MSITLSICERSFRAPSVSIDKDMPDCLAEYPPVTLNLGLGKLGEKKPPRTGTRNSFHSFASPSPQQDRHSSYECQPQPITVTL